MLGYTVGAANCLMGNIGSCEAKINQNSKLLNACARLDSVVGVLNVESYNYGSLPNQVPIWKMEHESTAETKSFLSTEISGSWRALVIGLVEVNK